MDLNDIMRTINESTASLKEVVSNQDAEQEILNQAPIRTADATEATVEQLQEANAKIEKLALDLDTERQERKVADEKAAQNLKHSNRVNRFFQIAALVISISSIAITIYNSFIKK